MSYLGNKEQKAMFLVVSLVLRGETNFFVKKICTLLNNISKLLRNKIQRKKRLALEVTKIKHG